MANSSSASFVIPRKCFTDEQLHLVKMHKYIAGFDEWHVNVGDNVVSFSTSMTNFGMKGYLYAIGIDYKRIVKNEDYDSDD